MTRKTLYLRPRSITVYKSDVVVQYDGLHWTPDVDPNGRDEVTMFSSRSRRRLAFVASNTSVDFLSMLTLTYPAEYPSDGRAVKRHFDMIMKRLQRRFSKFDYLWCLEFQERGAPHFHVLLSFSIDRQDKLWASQAWYEVVDSGDTKHLQAGTRFENIRKPGGAARYVVKYAMKMRQKRVPKDYQNVGRFWGHSRPVKPVPVAEIRVRSRQELAELFREWEYADRLVQPMSVLYNAAEVVKTAAVDYAT